MWSYIGVSCMGVANTAFRQWNQRKTVLAKSLPIVVGQWNLRITLFVELWILHRKRPLAKVDRLTFKRQGPAMAGLSGSGNTALHTQVDEIVQGWIRKHVLGIHPPQAQGTFRQPDEVPNGPIFFEFLPTVLSTKWPPIPWVECHVQGCQPPTTKNLEIIIVSYYLVYYCLITSNLLKRGRSQCQLNSLLMEWLSCFAVFLLLWVCSVNESELRPSKTFDLDGHSSKSSDIRCK